MQARKLCEDREISRELLVVHRPTLLFTESLVRRLSWRKAFDSKRVRVLTPNPGAPICAEDWPQQILTVGFVVRLGLSIALALALIASEASATEGR